MRRSGAERHGGALDALPRDAGTNSSRPPRRGCVWKVGMNVAAKQVEHRGSKWIKEVEHRGNVYSVDLCFHGTLSSAVPL